MPPPEVKQGVESGREGHGPANALQHRPVDPFCPSDEESATGLSRWRAPRLCARMLRLLGLTCLAVTSPARSLPIPSSNEHTRPGAGALLSAALPESWLIAVDGAGLAEVLGGGLEAPLVAKLLDTDLGRLWRTSEKSPAATLAWLEAWLGESPPDVLRSLTAGGLALGWYGEQRGVVLAGRGPGEDEVSGAIETVLAALGRRLGVPRALLEPRDASDGTHMWTLGEAHLVRSGRTWVLGQDEALVRVAVDRSLRGDAPPGASQRDHAVVARFDLQALAEAGNPGVANLRRSARAPGFRFLLGDALTALAASGTLTARLDLLESGLHLELEGDASTPPGQEDGPRAPDLARRDDLAFAVLHRDVARWIRDRAELFPAETLPRFAEALGNATLFAGGRDVEREVLPALSPWWTLVVREPDFDGARPAIDLPGLAVIVPVRSEDAGAAWVEAFQTVVAVSNVEASQQGRRGFRLGLEPHGRVTITRARAGHEDGSAPNDLRDNLEPAVATTDGLVILATHVSLVRDLLDRVAHAHADRELTRGERGAIDVGALARLVDRHRAPLAMQKRLEEGLSPERSAREVEFLRAALASFGRLEWHVSHEGPVRLALGLPLRFPGDSR